MNELYVEKNGIKLNNQWVVPHNLYLCVAYNAHINIEVCNTIGAVKYLFKFVYKGSDKITFSFNLPENTSNINSNDEINKFIDARYISASESIWRIFQYDLNSQNPNTVRLPVHLENQQLIIFKEKDNLNQVVNKDVDTQLTSFFKLNSTD